MEKQRGRRKSLVGVVISNKMDKTVVVAVEHRFPHPLYKKIVRRTKKYKAHDSGNSAQLGDIVRLEETRPLSKEKRWRIAETMVKGHVAEIAPREIGVPAELLEAVETPASPAPKAEAAAPAAVAEPAAEEVVEKAPSEPAADEAAEAEEPAAVAEPAAEEVVEEETASEPAADEAAVAEEPSEVDVEEPLAEAEEVPTGEKEERAEG